MKARLVVVAAFAALGLPGLAVAAPGGTIGSDSAACANRGPAIRVVVTGLKDRTGELKLELYPANEADFLRDDHALQREGKVFHRMIVPTPAGGPIALCIRAPAPGTYALLFTHNRDGKNKFNFWSDGAGLPSNAKLGRQRPKVTMARITVPNGVVTSEIRVQYLRGLSGFGPIRDR